MAISIVPDIVNKQDLHQLSADTTVREAVKLMADRHIGAVLVTENDKLVGIFTERDVTVRVVAQDRDPATTKVAEVMTKDPDTLAPDDAPAVALERMRERGFRHLPVVDGDDVVGIVSVRDLYAVVKGQLEEDIRNRDAFIFGNGYGGVS